MVHAEGMCNKHAYSVSSCVHGVELQTKTTAFRIYPRKALAEFIAEISIL